MQAYRIHGKTKTRKLSYRKDDRAMRPMYGCPENFRESLTTPMASFPKNFNGLFVPIEHINVHAKFEVRSFTRSRDNRGYPKNWAVPGYAHAPFCLKFLMDFCSEGTSECTGQI